jgi:hypothetical protein
MSNDKAQLWDTGDFAAVRLSMRFSIHRMYRVPVAKCPKCYLIRQTNLSIYETKTGVLVSGDQVFQQFVGISMGTNCAPLLADLFLYSYEAEFAQRLFVTG